MNEQLNLIKSSIKSIPNHPKEGIIFRDITSLTEVPEAFGAVIKLIADKYKDQGITKIVGTESRGFIFGAPVAVALNLPESLLLGGDVGNSVEKLNTAVLAVSGKANVDYADAFGNRAVLRDGEILQANLRVVDISALLFAEI